MMMIMMMMIMMVVSVSSTTFNFQNDCPFTVWPTTLGKTLLAGGGFVLEPGQSYQVSAEGGWSGRFWGRSQCSFDQSGKGSCATGDCGGLLSCGGVGGETPTTLAEFTLAADKTAPDFYDVSLVDGYNLPMVVVPAESSSSSSNYERAGCTSDINAGCPEELQSLDKDGRVVACRSACEAFGKPEYCCTGQYSTPQTCHPSTYSRLFKAACPTAYSYAYDDPSSTFTCTGPSQYTITFCPSP